LRCWRPGPRTTRRRAPRPASTAADALSQRSRFGGYRPYTFHAGRPAIRGRRGAVFRGLSVYTGNAHPKFARDIAAHLEVPLGDADVTKFANDEIFVKINENAREHDVYDVQSLVGPSVSDAIMELLIMLDAFKRASAGRITAVMPYYAYGRSDKKDQPRVPITARLLATSSGSPAPTASSPWICTRCRSRASSRSPATSS